VEVGADRVGGDPVDDEHRRPLEARPRRQAVRALLRDVAPVSADLQRDLPGESRGLRDRPAHPRLPLPGQDGRLGGRPGYRGLARGRARSLGGASVEPLPQAWTWDLARLARPAVLRAAAPARSRPTPPGGT